MGRREAGVGQGGVEARFSFFFSSFFLLRPPWPLLLFSVFFFFDVGGMGQPRLASHYLQVFFGQLSFCARVILFNLPLCSNRKRGRGARKGKGASFRQKTWRRQKRRKTKPLWPRISGKASNKDLFFLSSSIIRKREKATCTRGEKRRALLRTFFFFQGEKKTRFPLTTEKQTCSPLATEKKTRCCSSLQRL